MTGVRTFSSLHQCPLTDVDYTWGPEDFESSRHILYNGGKLKEVAQDSQPRVRNLSSGGYRYLEYLQLGYKNRIRTDGMAGFLKVFEESMLRQRSFDLTGYDKVFCSAWVTKKSILIGTKCNSLLTIDIDSGAQCPIPTLVSSPYSLPPGNDLCGIHAIAINPSRTLLATGASNPNDTGVYSIPDLTPVCIGEKGHEDWIFDIKWLDDMHYVSGARDCQLALWRVSPSMRHQYDTSPHSSWVTHKRYTPQPIAPSYYRIQCVKKAINKNREAKIRAISVDSHRNRILALNLNATITACDMGNLSFYQEVKLPNDAENVCLAQCPDLKLTVVGNRSFLSFFDQNLNYIRCLPATHVNCGIRSVSFRDNKLFVGTGTGNVFVVDPRQYKILESKKKDVSSFSRVASLRCGPGWVSPPSSNFPENIVLYDDDYQPAVYTHSFDTTGLKLFCAGGPLPANMKGSYAAIWE